MCAESIYRLSFASFQQMHSARWFIWGACPHRALNPILLHSINSTIPFVLLWHHVKAQKSSTLSVILVKFLATLYKTTVYYWILTRMFQTDSWKLFITSLLHGKKNIPGRMSKLFAVFFWWSSEAGGDEGWKMAFRDATPETWCTQSHCLIRLSIQLALLYRQGQG